MPESGQNAATAKQVGQYLVDAGVLKPEQLDEALDRQRRLSQAGFHVPLGTILEQLGAIDRDSVEAIVVRQRLDDGKIDLGEAADWEPFRAGVKSSKDKQNEKSQAQPDEVPESPSVGDKQDKS